MKKILILVVTYVFFSTYSGVAQYVTIPDSRFGNFLKAKYPSCFNNGMMDTTCPAIRNEVFLSIAISVYPSIEDYLNIDGIQYFTSLRTLISSNSYIKYSPPLPSSLISLELTSNGYIPDGGFLPQLPKGLRRLVCSGNFLNKLNKPLPDSLKYLDCSANIITDWTQFEGLPNKLDTLICSGNGLRYLPALVNSISYLDCSNGLDSMGKLPDNLKYFYTVNNLIRPVDTVIRTLSFLPDLPGSLIELYCQYNILTSLPLLPKSLRKLDMRGNRFTSLPDSFPQNLTDLVCGDNLTVNSLPYLPNSLKTLDCTGSTLTSLPPLPNSLTLLACSGNRLTALPVLPKTLTNLECGGNLLTELPALPDTMTNINLIGEGNKLNCLPKLPSPPKFQSLYIRLDTSKINCIPNMPSPPERTYIYALNASGGQQRITNIPLCNPINNKYNCSSFPVIKGKVYFDNNLNGALDSGEPLREGIKILLSNGNYTFTNLQGYYEIAADSIGLYSITAIPPVYYDASPYSANFSFSSYDTLVLKDFALQRNTIKDSLAISITSLKWVARPGFAFPFLVSYKNTGTTILSPSVVLKYDTAVLKYDSCSNILANNFSDYLLLDENNFVPGQQKNYIAYFTVKQSALIKGYCYTQAVIKSPGIQYSDSKLSLVKFAFDPNDKHATDLLTPAEVSSGKYIDYTIRFQNTGTDTAFTVIISDTLTSQLQWDNVEMLSTSHPCNTIVKNGVIYFQFHNILLPDSNVNEQGSHGFVSFRIKPKTTVLLNSTIQNKASIYFDYNVPVATNISATSIKNPTFTFKGTGNWDDPANWDNGLIPPSSITSGTTVIIDHQPNGICILNSSVTVMPGASVIVNTGKNLIIPGELRVK